LQFIDDYKKAIQETARVLKPNGKLLVMLLNPTFEFFEIKRRQANSYVNKIKHPYSAPIEKAIQNHFAVAKAEYYLGISNKQIFESQNLNLAVLYIIQGIKS
jgi:ubiquinone/menaquinone biosynthesis C-methylase UbiE